MAGDLTTTSYAILALLGVQPWTTYELAQQMDRSLRWFWPRAQSVLYNEPKKLVAHGLARSSRGRTGRRPRTVYEITPKGRRALRAWLDEPGRGPTLEFEALTQVAFADHGTTAQLLRTLRRVETEARAALVEALQRADEYERTGGPFPARLATIALPSKLLIEMSGLVVRWAHWAHEAAEAGLDEAPDGAFRLEWTPARVARQP